MSGFKQIKANVSGVNWDRNSLCPGGELELLGLYSPGHDAEKKKKFLQQVLAMQYGKNKS